MWDVSPNFNLRDCVVLLLLYDSGDEMSLLNVIKHLPGRHNQGLHAPHSGGGGYITGPDGLPVTLYHGTPKNFEDFRGRQKYTPQEQLGFGIHFAESQDFADQYATGKTGRVIPVRLKANKVLDADKIVFEGTPEFELAKKLAGRKIPTMKWDDGRKAIYLQNAIDAAHPKKAEAAIREAGYDAVKYQAKYGSRAIGGMSISQESVSYVVFEPEQVERL